MLTQTSIVRISNILGSCFAKRIPQHWHGIFQEGSTWADGPAFVSQCPIVSGDSFLYEFTVPDQAGRPQSSSQYGRVITTVILVSGTFWYHSHISTQYCDGLRGAFVVYDPNDPYADLYDVDDGMFPCIHRSVQ